VSPYDDPHVSAGEIADYLSSPKPKSMKALSLIQPYATLIMLGYNYKHHETRSWATKHRGLLGIHASAGKPKWAREAAEKAPIKAVLEAHGLTFDTLPRGAMLGTVNVVKLHAITSEFVATLTPMEIAAGDSNRWAWQLENRQKFGAPVLCKGALSLWEVPNEVKHQFSYN
jgi:hypothetical protein